MKLDLKDKKIISYLDLNARVPLSKLASRVRLSKQVVSYRIKKLEENKIIQGYNALIDVEKLDKQIYVIYFKLKNISSKEERKWFSWLEKHPLVAAVGKNAGEWDLTLVIICKDEIDQIIKKITNGKSNKIKKKLVTREIKSTYMNLEIIHPSQDRKKVSTSKCYEKVDEKDVLIINRLSKNSRESLVEISNNTNLTPNAVKYRIKQLEKKKIIIGFKTKINYELLGFLHFRVFLHLNNKNNKLFNYITSFLYNKGNVESVSEYRGYADVDFRCYCSNITEFYQLISQLKDQFIEEIYEVNSIIIFNWEKIDYFALQQDLLK